MPKKYTHVINDDVFTPTKVSVRQYYFAVLAEHAKEPNAGNPLVLQWCADQRKADRAAKNFAGKSWGGAWKNVRIASVSIK